MPRNPWDRMSRGGVFGRGWFFSCMSGWGHNPNWLFSNSGLCPRSGAMPEQMRGAPPTPRPQGRLSLIREFQGTRSGIQRAKFRSCPRNSPPLAARELHTARPGCIPSPDSPAICSARLFFHTCYLFRRLSSTGMFHLENRSSHSFNRSVFRVILSLKVFRWK